MTGAGVRKIRKAFGLSQTEFGKLVGVTFVTVSRWETNKNPVPDRMAKFMTLLAKTRPSRKGRQ